MKIINSFTDITGIGVKRATEWYGKGYRSIENIKKDIKLGKIKSTHHIDIGLKYYKDFRLRIPRNEVKQIGDIFKTILKKIDKNLVCKICGSYRRGLTSSGDIDIIITNPKIKGLISKERYLSKVVEECIKNKLIIDNLTSLGEKKYMGVCKLNKTSKARRIDIRCVNSYEYYAAIIYFTGSAKFNIYLRNKALKKGYKLNEYNLEKISNKQKIYIKYEKELFEILDIEYVSPKKRNI
jgi:DNA polymerase/3'-5' exonuclease PolX